MIQFSISTQFSSILEQWQWRSTPHPPKLQDTRWESLIPQQMQSMYSAAPADWSKGLSCFLIGKFIIICNIHCRHKKLERYRIKDAQVRLPLSPTWTLTDRPTDRLTAQLTHRLPDWLTQLIYLPLIILLTNHFLNHTSSLKLSSHTSN